MGITSVVQLSEEFLPHAEANITHLFASSEALIVGSRWRKLLLENDDFVNGLFHYIGIHPLLRRDTYILRGAF